MFESERAFTPKPEKPSVLYHASHTQGLSELEPRSETQRHSEDAPKVYATPTKEHASLFLVPTDDSWVASGSVDDVPYMIISDQDRFRALDQGGAIYTVSSSAFEVVENTGETEWATEEPLSTVDEEYVPSAEAYMKNNGVIVKFVDQNTFDELEKDDDKRFRFLTDQNT